MRTNTVYANSYPQEVRAAIYCRLSKDDDLSGPSASRTSVSFCAAIVRNRAGAWQGFSKTMVTPG